MTIGCMHCLSLSDKEKALQQHTSDYLVPNDGLLVVGGVCGGAMDNTRRFYRAKNVRREYEEIEHRYQVEQGRKWKREAGQSIRPGHGISRRNQFLIWPSGWQSW